MNAEELQAEADSLAHSLLDLMGRNIWNQATYKDASDKIIALVTHAVREEREECAKACDEVATRLAAENPGEQGEDEAGGAKECAAAIRQRGE